MSEKNTLHPTTPPRTTGDLRKVLSYAIADVLNGDLDLAKATALHKLSRDISDNLLSEHRITMANLTLAKPVAELGDVPLF